MWRMGEWESEKGTTWALNRSLPLCPASRTSSWPLKKAAARGLSSPVAIVVTDGAAAAGIGSNAATTPAASSANRCRFRKSHSSMDLTRSVSPGPREWWRGPGGVSMGQMVHGRLRPLAEIDRSQRLPVDLELEDVRPSVLAPNVQRPFCPGPLNRAAFAIQHPI